MSVGSGLVFFNKTKRSKALATAWAEAMAFPANQQAPDDQVLDELLVNGWLERASYGWLPSSYLHMMPAYYRGVRAIIDHDHLEPVPGIIQPGNGFEAGAHGTRALKGGNDDGETGLSLCLVVGFQPH